jgi:hypothetical protein
MWPPSPSNQRTELVARVWPSQRWRGASRESTGPDGRRAGPGIGWCGRSIRPAGQWRGRVKRQGGGSCSRDQNKECTRPPGTVDRRRTGSFRARGRTSLDRMARRKLVRLGTKHSSCHNAISVAGQIGGYRSRSTRFLCGTTARPPSAFTRSVVAAHSRVGAGVTLGGRQE